MLSAIVNSEFILYYHITYMYQRIDLIRRALTYQVSCIIAVSRVYITGDRGLGKRLGVVGVIGRWPRGAGRRGHGARGSRH
jgi:hypothetical protein